MYVVGFQILFGVGTQIRFCVLQEGPNVQLDVRFGVANPRLQLSMGSFEMYNGPGTLYSDESINSVRPLRCTHCIIPHQNVYLCCEKLL